jgi:DNA-binding helix-hairpin-helix protein with protein kinase domain
VIFPQVHAPGEAAQSDFTHMTSLGITPGGVPFPHLVFHLVLVYSNVEAVQVCFQRAFRVAGQPRPGGCGQMWASLLGSVAVQIMAVACSTPRGAQGRVGLEEVVGVWPAASHSSGIRLL